MKKASLRKTRAFLRARHTAGTAKAKRTPPQHDVDLRAQLQKVTTLVEKLSNEVEGLRETKAYVEEHMSTNMGDMIEAYTKEYLDANLVTSVTPKLVDLFTPIREELNTRIRSRIEKFLRSNPFYLQTTRPTTAPEDLTVTIWKLS